MKLFVFGSTGDLVRRKVMKALQDIDRKDLEIYAIGRKNMDEEEYQEFICSDWCVPRFRKSIKYFQVDFDRLNFENFKERLDKTETNYFYISLPPTEYNKILNFLKDFITRDYKVKILIEKPFGWNLKSALELKRIIDNSKLNGNIFISDHYLFKKNFINLPRDFDKIKVVSIEKVGLENRVSYYDSVGAMRDMIQSHFLNLVVKNMDFKINPDKINVTDFVKGQYKGYSEELGKKSSTETFVHLKFNYHGKEFEFITGKAFDKKEGFVEIDGRRFLIGEDNSYIEIFKKFFDFDMSEFPSVGDSVLGWKIIEKIEKVFNGKLKFYEKGSKFGEVLTQKNS